MCLKSDYILYQVWSWESEWSGCEIKPRIYQICDAGQAV